VNVSYHVIQSTSVCCCCKMLVVDVDGGRLLHSYGDEHHIIPRKLQKALVSSIKDDRGNVVVTAAVGVSGGKIMVDIAMYLLSV